MVLMSFGGPNNSVVRDFVGGVRAASYWIGNRLLSASDIVNDSSATGATVKAALNTLSTSSTAVFPFVASGLAEQDLVSYDASAVTWRNRTKAAALKGTGTDSFVVGTGSLAAGTNDIILGPSSGASANTGNDNIGIGADTLDGATVALQNVIAIGGTALSGALTAAANGTVAIGAAAGSVLTSGAKNTFAGFQSGVSVTVGSRNTLFGYFTDCASNSEDNALLGYKIGSSALGSRNVAIGSECLDLQNGAIDCVAIGYRSMHDVVTAAAIGTVAVGRAAFNSLTSGAKNTAVGYLAGGSVITGSRNTLFGWTVVSSTAADDNTFIGTEVGSTSVGSRNTAVGSQAFNSASAAVTDCVVAGYNALTGVISSTAPSGSVAIGSTALQACTTGLNTAVGFAAGLAIIAGTRNTFVGYNAFGNAGSASGTNDVTAIGYAALSGATVSASNTTAVGSSSLSSVTNGGGNTALGSGSGSNITGGSNNVFLGFGANGSVNSRSGCIVIGRGASAAADDTLVFRMGNTSTKEIVITPVVNATPPAGAVTYLPITIGGTSYRILLQAP